MAASHSLLAQATHALQRKIEAGKKVRESHKKEEEVIVCGVSSLAGSAAAGLIDAKVGKGGNAAMLFQKAATTGGTPTGGVPTNLVLGVALTIPALAIEKFPAKGAVAAAGLAILGAGAYRYIVDHVKPATATPAAS